MCIAPKVEEEADEGVQTEMENKENISLLEKDKTERQDVNSPSFEELTEEVKMVNVSGHGYLKRSYILVYRFRQYLEKIG